MIPPRRNRVLRIFTLRGRYRVLHATTLAFFLSFVVWFNFAPFAVEIGRELGFSPAQLATLGLCNLALTIPARLFVGMLLDRFGPRRLFAGLLIGAVVPNTVFAFASSFPVMALSRLAVGMVGAGFVVGIRMVSEWFEAEEIGTAEGVYGGWGNFGSAAAALGLPAIGLAVAGGSGSWRWAVALSGVVAALYGVAYLFLVRDTPEGKTYQRPRRQGALEVTSRSAVVGLVLLQVPVVAVLAVVAHRVARVGVISEGTLRVVWGLCLALGVYLIVKVLRVNQPALTSAYPAKDRYRFSSVVILSLAYFVTFGAELTVVSLLPTFFAETFGLQVAAAGAAASAFAFTNLVTRPGGGLASDMLGRRRATLAVLLVGTAASFLVLATLSEAWPLAAGIALVALASVFVQGGNGAVFAMVPLVRRNVGGQIAGIAGSYGNIGGVLFSSLLFFTMDEAHPAGDTRLLFVVIAVAAALVAVLCRWLPDLDEAAPPVSVPESTLPAVHIAEEIAVSASTLAVNRQAIDATQPSA